jgi:hypothetical protein
MTIPTINPATGETVKVTSPDAMKERASSPGGFWSPHVSLSCRSFGGWGLGSGRTRWSGRSACRA